MSRLRPIAYLVHRRQIQVTPIELKNSIGISESESGLVGYRINVISNQSLLRESEG